MTHSDNTVMTEWDIREWVFHLGRDDHERIRTIRHLVRNRKGDGMSPVDYDICTHCLQQLEANVAKAGTTGKHKRRKRFVVKGDYKGRPHAA